ncbi:MAG: NAD-dependent epimerase/dehydratase family protein [Anaerolineales bacterium]
MRILITGVAGFLGKPLARRLLDEGHTVRGIDDLSTGDLAGLPDSVDFAQADVTTIGHLWAAMADIDTVVHLAAHVAVRESVRYPRNYNDINVGGTVTVLEAMRDRDARRLVFASSGAIYGTQAAQPLTEDTRPAPESPYAVSKLASEHYIQTIGRLWKLQTISLRVFNAYGPGQYLSAAHPPVIPQFFKQILGGGSMVISGDGRQTRDFIYSEDVVAALARAATIDKLPPVDVINVGSGIETSIRDLAALIGDITRQKPELLHNPSGEPGVSRMQADLTRLKSTLGIVPQTSLANGLRRILEDDPRFNRSQS